jgi:NitT/TauT family transport system substrate-binding protein
MRYKRLLSVIMIVGLMGLFVLSGCGEQKLTTLKVNEVTHSVFYAPQYAAMNLGFFEEEGLDIELTNGGGADKSMTAVLSGEADIGLMGPEAAIYVYNEGKEDHAVIVGQVTKRDGSFIVGREADEDFDWESLRGKTIIGGRKGGIPEMTLEYVLKSKGLNPGEDVEVLTNIQFDLTAGAFTGGTGDYATLFEPVASTLESEGKAYVVAAVGEASGEVPYTAYMAKKSYVEKNSDTVERFLRALARGQEWVNTHTPEEIAEAIAPSFADADLDILASVAQRYKDTDAWMTTPVMTEDSFTRLQDIMESAGELEQRVPFDKLIDNSYAEEALK